MSLRRASLPAVVLVCAVAVAPGAARAQHGGYGGLSTDAPAAPAAGGDGAAADQIVKELEGKRRDPGQARVVAEPLRQAKKALERARGARVAGDPVHARMLDGMALEWAQTARDLERAAAAEAVATTAASKAREVATRVERARALLEETQARRGRAAAELERVEAEAKGRVQSAADAEADRLDAKKKGKPPKGAAEKPKPKAGDAPPPAVKPEAPKKTETPKKTEVPSTPAPAQKPGGAGPAKKGAHR